MKKDAQRIKCDKSKSNKEKSNIAIAKMYVCKSNLKFIFYNQIGAAVVRLKC